MPSIAALAVPQPYYNTINSHTKAIAKCFIRELPWFLPFFAGQLSFLRRFLRQLAPLPTFSGGKVFHLQSVLL